MDNLKRSLVRNTFFNALGYFWTLLIGFLVTPILIHFIGLDAYGLYILYGSALSWLWVLDLGMSKAASRFMSKYAAEGDEKRFAECHSTLLAVKALGGILIVGLTLLGADAIARRLGYRDPAFAGQVLRLLGLTWVVSNFSSAYTTTLSALHRMDLPNKIGMAMSIPGTIAAVAALCLGWGLQGYLTVNLVSALVCLGTSRLALRRVGPGANASFRGVTFRELKELFRFSRLHIAYPLAHTFLASADRLALGADLHSVSLYQLGATVGWRIREVTTLSISASLPAATDLYTRGDWMGLNQLLRRGMKYLVLLGFPLLLFTAIFAEEVLILWLGRATKTSTLVLRILAVGHLVYTLSTIAAVISIASNRPRIQATASVLALVVSIGTYIAWGCHHGPLGLAVCVSAGFVILGAFMISLAYTAMRGRISLSFGNSVGRPITASLMVAASVSIPAKWITLAYPLISGRMSAASFLAATAAASLALYAAALWLLKVLDRRDIDSLKSIFREDSASTPAHLDPTSETTS